MEEDGKDDQLSQIRSLLIPFVLRRMKIEVLDQLTDKQTRTERVVLGERQREIYDAILRREVERRREMEEMEAQRLRDREVDDQEHQEGSIELSLKEKKARRARRR